MAELPPVFPRLDPRHKIGYAPTPFRRKESPMQSPLTFRFNDGTEVRRLGLNGRTRLTLPERVRETDIGANRPGKTIAVLAN